MTRLAEQLYGLAEHLAGHKQAELLSWMPGRLHTIAEQVRRLESREEARLSAKAWQSRIAVPPRDVAIAGSEADELPDHWRVTP